MGDETYSDLNIPEDKLLAGKEVKADVLTDVGATLPKRDSIDARVVADAENRTGSNYKHGRGSRRIYGN